MREYSEIHNDNPQMRRMFQNKQPDVPLTKQEVTNVVSNVLATLLGISDININNISPKTPIGIAVATPTASVVDNINRNENDANISRLF